MTTDSPHDTSHNATRFAPRRWGLGIRTIAACWVVLLCVAWARGQIALDRVLFVGAFPAAVYWTLGTLLEHARATLDATDAHGAIVKRRMLNSSNERR